MRLTKEEKEQRLKRYKGTHLTAGQIALREGVSRYMAWKIKTEANKKKCKLKPKGIV